TSSSGSICSRMKVSIQSSLVWNSGSVVKSHTMSLQMLAAGRCWRRLRGRAAAGTRPALALVHRLHTSRGNLVTFGYEISRQALRGRHEVGPWVGAAEEIGRGVDGEVGRRDRVEIVPVDGERHRYARSYARTVGG